MMTGDDSAPIQGSCPTSMNNKEYFSWKTFLSYTGPGYLIAIAYLDPGNLEADLQAGSYTKYKLLWVLFGSLGVGLVLQAMSLRIGVFTGKHLAQLCREEYDGIMPYLLWICAEISIITCDMQAIITSAIALKIIFGLPLWGGCLFTCFDVVTFLIIELRQYHSVEYLFAFLVSVMAICFFWNFGINPPDTLDVLDGLFIPKMSYYTFAPAVGVIGSIILPQNYFIHSGLVLNLNSIDRACPAKMNEATKYMLIDTTAALFVAFLINFAVICSFAEIFYSDECDFYVVCSDCEGLMACMEESSEQSSPSFCNNGNDSLGVCKQIGLSDAGVSLEGALGPTSSIIWALGLLASGQSSTMTITYAGQFVLDGFFEVKLPLYWRVLFCRLTALMPALVAALISTSNSNQLDDITEWGNIIASVCVPFSIIPMLKFNASRKLMGDNVLGLCARIFIWVLTLFLVFTNIYLVWEYMFLFQQSLKRASFLPLLCLFSVVYLACIYFTGKDDIDMLLDFCRQKFWDLGSCDNNVWFFPLKLANLSNNCDDEATALFEVSPLVGNDAKLTT